MTTLLAAWVFALLQDYTFELDGKPADPWTISVAGTRERPAPGDLITLEGHLMVLGEPGAYRFKRGEDVLERMNADGSSMIEAARIRESRDGDRTVWINPLEKLTDKDVAALRGLEIDAWPPGIEEKLKALDPARVCVTISDRADMKGALPPLPEKLQYLFVDRDSSSRMDDLSRLSTYEDLRAFMLDGMGGGLDAASIRGNKGLKLLRLWRVSISNAGELAALSELRHLNLSFSDGLADIEFVGRMKSLTTLNVRQTGVRDLSPLAGLASLTEVDANSTAVNKLPFGEMPALRELRIMSTAISDDDVAAFAKANPKCRVYHRWGSSLKLALEGTTRIRVRSGGTCHRSRDDEKTLAEEKEPEKVRTLIDALGIDEPRSGFHCMCCGEPSFEFYKEGTLLVTLGFHHGRSLRWPGEWPGDGLMTDGSADALCAWLDEHGIPGPRREREEGKRAEAAARRRAAACRRLMGEALADDVEAERSREAVLRAFETRVPDAVQRAELVLKLFGCDDGSWNLYAGIDDVAAGALLPSLDSKDLTKAVRNAVDDAQAANGAARWLFSEGKEASIDADAFRGVLPQIAARAMAHPRAINRRRTLRALGRIGGEAAIGVLRRVLAGEIDVRTLKKDEETEPGGMVSFGPGDSDVKNECGDRAYAALLLGKLKDRDSLSKIRELAGAAKGEDKSVLDEAVQTLKGE